MLSMQRRLPTIRDVASRAGVSPMTVSRALNYPEKVAPSTLSRVQEAIVDTGFVPDRAAKQLASTKVDGRGAAFQNGIGLVYPARHNIELGSYFACALEAASRQGFRVFPVALDGPSPSTLASARAEGLLLLPGALPLADLSVCNVPAVYVGADGSSTPIPSIFVDEEASGYGIVRSLVEANHRRIGFIGNSLGSARTELHFRGFRRALSTLGVAVDPAFMMDAMSQPHDSAARCKNGFFLRPASELPSAIVACSTELGVACLSAANAHGLRVPDDLTIAVLEDYRGPNSAWPQLVRVPVPVSELCREGISMLIRQIGNRASNRRTGSSQPRLVRAIPQMRAPAEPSFA